MEIKTENKLGIDQKIFDKVQYWSESKVFDEATRTDIHALVATKNSKEIEDRFYRDLEFGTGGLRGIIGAGTNRINIYNIKRASLALGNYVKKTNSSAKSIAVTHDSRNFSRQFAMASAEIFAALGFTVYLTKELRPVPMLSFMTRYFNCSAGVCVTASHNPPQYNGYKVYWSDGAQVVSPHDKNIIKEYERLTDYGLFPNLTFAQALAEKKIIIVSDELDQAYFEKIKTLRFDNDLTTKDNFKIVYTPLHGAGLFPVTHALKLFGFNNVTVVPEQEKPDGNFPTVKYPNPEEKDAMNMAVSLGEKIFADLVLATDPDADRIGFVVKEDGAFRYFNGNQIGCLLIEYFLRRKKYAAALPKNAAIIKTIVTTDLQRDIARFYNVACFETLTGFKWICALIEKWETSGEFKYICGGEESYGFLADTFVRDKDGVASCAIAAEMVFYFKQQNLTLSAVLDEIFCRHGIYWESLLTITLPGKDGAEAIKTIMNQFRTQPPMVIAGIHVKNILDYAKSQSYSMQENQFKALESLTLPKSDVLQFKLEDGSSVSVRPSGTEPKIKFYVSVREPLAIGCSNDKLQALKLKTEQRTREIESEFVRLTQNFH